MAPCNKITERLDRLTELKTQTARLSAIVRHSLLLIAILLIFLIFLELLLTCRKRHREIVPFHDDSDLFERSSEETSNSGRRISREDGKPLHLLGKSDLVQCDDYESFTIPTGADIKDKGKSD